MLQRYSPGLRQTLRQCRPDNCARSRQPDAERPHVVQRNDNRRPERRLVLKTFAPHPACSFYLHLTSSPSFPLSSVNVSSSEEPASFNVNVIVFPLIEPVYVAEILPGASSALTGPPRSMR